METSEIRVPIAPADFFVRLDKVAATAEAGSGKLIFLPWLYGERSPVDDHHVRGGFFNMSLDSTRAHLVRAVLEGVAYNSRWLLMYVEKMCGRKFEAINMIGGGAKSDLWCQIHADVLNRTIRKVKDPILANARGAACLAAVALGEMEYSHIADRVEIEKTFQPNPSNRKLYDKLFKEYVKYYERNKAAHARIN